MHPELARIEATYLRLVQAVTDGELSLDDALATLEHQQAIDGAGAVWGLDADGRWWRSAHPGAARQAADPARFVPLQLPPSAHSGLPPWANPELAGERAVPVPAPARPGRERSLGHPARAPIGAWLRRNARHVAVVGVCVAILVIVVARRDTGGGGPDQVIGNPTTGTWAPDTTTSTAPAPSTSTTTPAAAPDRAQAQALVDALSSPQVAAVRGALADGRIDPLEHARWAGLATAGLTARAGAATEGRAGEATGPVELVADDGTVVTTLTARYVQRDGRWRLAGWPTQR